jgi:hypothetical protein
MGIATGGAYMPSGTSALATIPTNLCDLALEVDVTIPAGGGTFDVAARFVDSLNYIRLHVVRDTGSTNSLQLLTVVAGTSTQFGFTGSAALTLNASNRIRLVAKGNAYQVYVGGVSKLSATDAGSNFLTAGIVGVGFSGSDTASRLTALRALPVSYVDGDAVAVWPDCAAPMAGYAQQGTVANRPTYKASIYAGRPTIRFDGTNDVFITDQAANQQSFTLIAVVKIGGTGNRTIIGADNGGAQLRVATSGVPELLSANTASIGAGTIIAPTSGLTVLAVTFDSAGAYVHYVDGQPAGPNRNAATFTAGTKLRIGALAAAEFFSGDICEVLRWNRPLLGAEIRAATKGLAAKWSAAPTATVRTRTPNPPQATVVKGSNFHPKAAYLSASDPWATLWSSWDWAGWIKKGVDLAVAQGANTVRLIGSIQGVADGTLTQSAYLANQAQLADYCRSIGVHYYACGGDFRHLGTATPAFIRSFLLAQAQNLAPYGGTVLGFELINELNTGYSLLGFEAAQALVAQISQDIRNAGVTIPLATSDVGRSSNFYPQAERLGDTAALIPIAPYLDFFDAHLYATDGTPADIAPYAAMTGRKLLVGEFGISRTGSGSTAGDRAAYYERQRQIQLSNPQILGSIQWAVINDSYGLYDEATLTLQSDVSPTWALFPRR